MVAIKAHFDGKTIVVPPSMRGAPPGDVLVIFEKAPDDIEESHGWMKAQEARRPDRVADMLVPGAW